jgi:GT2 family glycosyltransferase
MGKSISIIIATFNRDMLLAECLDHMEDQRFAPGDEIIVVDNGSTDLTSSVIIAHEQSSAVPIIGLVESRPGKPFALASALTVARGDILAFTDDDVNVDPGWVEAIRRAMEDEQVSLVGGPVRPRWQAAPPKWLDLLCDGHQSRYSRLGAPLGLVDYGERADELGSRTLPGANLAVRREVLQWVGGFAPHLGKLRRNLRFGEDHDLCGRVQSAGFKGMYAPGIVVRHFVPVDRMRIRYFLDWFYWSGITNALVAESDDWPARSVFGVPFYLFQRLFTATCKTIGSIGLQHWTAALNSAAEAAYAIGYAAGVWRGAGDHPTAERVRTAKDRHEGGVGVG